LKRFNTSFCLHPTLYIFSLKLSDVKEGGYTAFPIAGVAAVPVRGSTVVWYNLKLNGEQDRTTEHGACPVIMGQKLGSEYCTMLSLNTSIHIG
jgi:prolyl 4-hydroxylase